MHCSLARSLDAIGDWWTPLIIRDIHLGVVRFDDIAEDLGISRNLLARRLKHLAAKGVVARHAYQARPARHEYRLTDSGRELVPIILALTAWGDRWVGPAEGPPMRFVHRTCHHVLRPTVVCAECGEPVEAAAVDTVPGPGGAAKPGTLVLARRLAVAQGR